MAPPWAGVAFAAALSSRHAAATAAPAPLGLARALDLERGSFRIEHGGQSWLGGGEYRVGALSSSGGSLVLTASREAMGEDVFGRHRATTLDWASASVPGEVLMQASFRTYPGDAGLIVFEQHFPSAVPLAALLGNSTSLAGTLFPGLWRAGRGTFADLPAFVPGAQMSSSEAGTVGSYGPDRLGGVPLVIYNATDARLPMLVFSPLNSALAHQMAQDAMVFGAGVKATATEIPAGWRQLFLLSAGMGINDGMMTWGDRMLKFFGKPRVDNRYRDDIHGGLGFWTDNGGFYHYSIGSNRSLGSNYEEVLTQVHAYHQSIGVPFRHWQLDSWWYPKEGYAETGSGGPVLNWTANSSIFPHGLAHMQDVLRLPLVLHNRHWSTRSDYVRSWPDIDWYTTGTSSGTSAIPKDPSRFFRRFFTQQEGWGLAMYEHDWLSATYDTNQEMQANISLGDLYMRGMAEEAARSGRTVQLCMAYPNHVLSAAAHPAVTNARLSGDYNPGQGGQWAIGAAALTHWALGILPFKDGFYSSSQVQVGGASVGPETSPDREALIATLSCAMVAPMDGIFLLNASRLRATCRQDGVLLKPDRPITITDACFRAKNPACLVYQTYSDVAGWGRVHYYYNDNGEAPLLPEEVYLEPAADCAVYNWYSGALVKMQASNRLTPGYEGHIYAIATPIRDGWIFLGEVGAFATASDMRFASVRADGGGLAVQVRGVGRESVRVCAAPAATLQVVCQEASFPAGGESLATLLFGPPVLVA